MRQTKQDRIDQLELWLENSKAEIAQMKAQQERASEWRRSIYQKDQETIRTLKEALGRIIKMVDRVISQRRSTEDERAIKEVAKRALEDTK